MNEKEAREKLRDLKWGMVRKVCHVIALIFSFVFILCGLYYDKRILLLVGVMWGGLDNTLEIQDLKMKMKNQ